jgi:hypothetical protein
MGGKTAGFGNSPRYSTIKVTIVGHASPRWRGVANDEADRRNQQLSIQRAEATKQAVTQELRKHFGANVDIKFDVTSAPGNATGNIEVGSYGVGSTQTRIEAGGNRKDNSEYARRVEVAVEMITSTGTLIHQSLPPQKHSAYTRFWYIAIKEIHVAAVAGAFGEATFILRNSLSNKKMLARATLIGGGINTSLTSGKKGAQWTTAGADIASMYLTKYPEASFSVDREVGFNDFDGTLIRVEKIEGKLIYGAKAIYMTMLGFGDGAETIPLLHKRGWGLPKLEGWVAAGKLKLIGTAPGDYWEEDGQVQSTMVFTDRTHNEVLVLNFETATASLSMSSRTRVADYIGTWSRRMIGGS